MLRPECTQCQKYGVNCPGYTRTRKFMDEGPTLHQRFGQHRPNPKPKSESTTTPTTPSASVSLSPTTSTPTESIDERLVPSLVTTSHSAQQPVIFGTFVLKAFTKWFGLNKLRVHVPWTAHVAQNIGQDPAFDAAIHSLTAIFLAHTHKDTSLHRSSREVYTKALRLFGNRIRRVENIHSSDSVSITIALSLFEAYSQTDPDSWARHAGATALLMTSRGPRAHLTGFDRCLYLSFRSFIVAEAFVNGKRCVFETPEWQAHIDQVRAEDMASPKVKNGPIALIIDLQDRIFCEVAKAPGFLFHARRVHLAPDRLKAVRSLAVEIRRCSQAMYTLTGQLRLAAAVQGYGLKTEDAGKDKHEKLFIGPIPSTFPQEFANSVLRGADICLFILRLLLGYLECVEVQDMSRLSGKANGRSDPLPFRIVSKLAHHQDQGKSLGKTRSGGVQSADEWLDQVAASMGLEAFDIITDGSEYSDQGERPRTLETRSICAIGQNNYA